jgi:hypothetical protein
VAILAEAAASPLDAPEWGRGAAATGAAEIGVDAIGTDETGMVAIGTTGTAIGGIVTLWSLSVTSAFRIGGAGVGAHPGDIHMDTAMGTRTDTTGTATAIRTVMAAMDTAITAMAMVTGTDMAVAANTALPLGREWPSYNGDSPVRAIIADQSMESSGLRRGAQYVPTRQTTAMQAQADQSLSTDSPRASC